MLRVPPHFTEGLRRMKEGAVGVADTVPIFAQICHHAARIAGESTIAFYRDAETFLRCEFAADELYQMDAPTIHYDNYNIEAEALGAQLTWAEGEAPAVDHARPLLGAIDGYKALKPIKIGQAGRMPYILEISKRLMDLGLSPKVRWCGMFSLAANLVGLENLVVAAITEPDRVHGLLRFLTHEVIAPWIVCQREACGRNETATGADAFASIPLVSLDIIREFCVAHLQELDQLVGKVRWVGVWGESALPDPAELLEIKREWSPETVQVLDPDITALGPAYYRRWADGAAVGLTMGMDAHLARTGPVAAIKDRARRFIEEAGLAGRFVLFINDVTYDTPPDHVHAVVSVCHEYRRDPSGTRYVRRSR